MDLRLMHEFLTLAQTGNYVEASDLLFISQPTLSRHIKSLEEELTVPLFERNTRHVSLTKFGRILFIYAQKFLELQSQFQDELQAEKQESIHTLNIATIPAMGYYQITSLLERFRAQHGGCKLSINPCYNQSALDVLRQRGCELAFVRERTLSSDDEVIRLPFAVDHVVAVVPRSHPLANYESVPFTKIKDEPIITLPRNVLVFDIINSACIKAGFEPRVIYGDHSISHIMDLIRLGMGVGLVFDKHLTSADDDLKAVSLTPICNSYISLCYLNNTDLSENAKALLEIYRSDQGREKKSGAETL